MAATAVATVAEAETATADAHAPLPDETAVATAMTAVAVAAMPRAAVEAARARLDAGTTDPLRPDDPPLPETADEGARLLPMRPSRDLLADTATSRAPTPLPETVQTEGTTDPSALPLKRSRFVSRISCSISKGPAPVSSCGELN